MIKQKWELGDVEIKVEENLQSAVNLQIKIKMIEKKKRKKRILQRKIRL